LPAFKSFTGFNNIKLSGFANPQKNFMENQIPNNPQSAGERGDACCFHSGFCYCRAIMALAIIVLAWLAPSWGNIAITILAILIILGAGGCVCRKKKIGK